MSREFYKDDRYFEDYIMCQNKRIEKFTDTLNKLGEGDSTKTAQCQRYLANFNRDLMSAKYSIGASRQEVQKLYMKYLEAVKNSSVADYAEMVDILSLAILLDVSIENIECVLKNTAFDADALVSVLKNIIQKKDLATESDDLLFSEIYGVFYQYIRGNVDKGKFLKYMEEEWYDSCKNFSWYDSHKSAENVYVGYWSWLAGAVLKMNTIIVTDRRYIPCDLL